MNPFSAFSVYDQNPINTQLQLGERDTMATVTVSTVYPLPLFPLAFGFRISSLRFLGYLMFKIFVPKFLLSNF